MRMAVVDIGTVTTRLLVADVDGMLVKPLDRQMRITHLGEGLRETGVLSKAAMGRVRDALVTFRESIERFGAVETVTLATSAARDAQNADEFTAMLEELGYKLAIIPGAREAELSFLGAASSFPGPATLVVDIGGGSTEVTFGSIDSSGLDGTYVAPRIEALRSFDIGCRRMTDAYLKSDPPIAEETARLRADVREAMQPWFDALPQTPRAMVAVAGTATSVVSMFKHMDVYDPDEVHGTVVTAKDLAVLTDALSRRSLKELRHVAGLEPDRASVIVAGLIVLGCVLELSGLEAFTVSETDILCGALIDCAHRKDGEEA
jgi:exopolyphosphatase/guanosine-5'-triphosphate,3'-diphosphate pyrophosphatase